jgi:hypothetical protein
MSVWKSPYALMPLRDAAIWIRRFPFYDTPVEAISDGEAGCRCHVPDTNEPPDYHDLTLTWAEVHSWKPDI